MCTGLVCKEVGPTTGKMAAVLPRKKKCWDSTASSPGQSARGSCRDFSAKGGGEGNDLQAAAAHTFGASGANGAGAPRDAGSPALGALAGSAVCAPVQHHGAPRQPQGFEAFGSQSCSLAGPTSKVVLQGLPLTMTE